MFRNNLNKWFKIGIIVNTLIEVNITLIAIFLIDGYFFEIIDITENIFDALSIIISLITFSVLVIGLIGYLLFDFLFVQYKEKIRRFVVGLLVIISIAILFLGMLWIYVLFIPEYPILQDPFDLRNFNSLLADLYLIWWFLGFVISILIISFVVVTSFWTLGL